MKAALLKRLFKAIHEIDDKNLRQFASVIIEEERKKGHEILANQLEILVRIRVRLRWRIALVP